MRRTVLPAAAPALALAAVVLVVGTGAQEAWAGVPRATVAGDGAPDVAFVVAGGSGRAVTVRAGDAEFGRLWQLLEPTRSGSERVPEAWREGRYPRVRATVVWGLTGVGGWPATDRAPGGDVAVRREDQLGVAADGTPWVRSDPSPEVVDDDIRWHRASRGMWRRMRREAWLREPGGDGGTGGGAVRWGLTGLAAGLVAGASGALAAVRRTAARREDGPPWTPRQELIDL
jgi:hypothetical protein